MSRTFYDFTLSPIGDLRSRRTHDAAGLVPAAVAVFGGLIARHGSDFRVPIPDRRWRHIELQYSSADPSAALATFWIRGRLGTSSVLVSGRDPAADAEALDAFQKLLTRIFHGSAVEPGFALLGLVERPLIVSVPWPAQTADLPDLSLIADMETCLAAAWFFPDPDPQP